MQHGTMIPPPPAQSILRVSAWLLPFRATFWPSQHGRRRIQWLPIDKYSKTSRCSDEQLKRFRDEQWRRGIQQLIEASYRGTCSSRKSQTIWKCFGGKNCHQTIFRSSSSERVHDPRLKRVEDLLQTENPKWFVLDRAEKKSKKVTRWSSWTSCFSR